MEWTGRERERESGKKMFTLKCRMIIYAYIYKMFSYSYIYYE